MNVKVHKFLGFCRAFTCVCALLDIRPAFCLCAGRRYFLFMLLNLLDLYFFGFSVDALVLIIVGVLLVFCVCAGTHDALCVQNAIICPHCFDSFMYGMILL